MSKSFELPEELTIYSAVETRDALMAWLAELPPGAVLEISAAKVAEIDGAGVQLLASLAHMQQPWRLTSASSAVQAACDALGLGTWLAEQTQTV
ncbi:MAG: hypothetical protein OHK0048_26780 [Rhodoferax sp.]